MINLLAGLADGYVKGLNSNLEDQQKSDLRKLQIKQFQRELDAKDQIEQAKQGLLSYLTKATAPTAAVQGNQDYNSPGADENTGFDVQSHPAMQGMSFKQAMSSPEAMRLALGAGHSLNDLKQFQQPSLTELLASLQTNGAVGNSGLPGAPTNGQSANGPTVGNPGSVQFSGLEVDADGKPKLKFDTSTVKNWALSSDGKTEVGYDDHGRAIAKRLAGPDKRQDEDKPLGVAGAKDMVDAKGNNPPPTMTPRQAVELGYSIKEDKLPMDQAARTNLANEGAKNINKAIDIIMPGGKLDKQVILGMDAPMGGLGRGREVNQLLYPAIAGQILLQSGVAVRPEEYSALTRSYVPTGLDFSNPGLAEKKLERLKGLLEGNLDLTSLPPSIRARVEQRRSSTTPTATTAPEQTAVNPTTGERLVLRGGKWVKP